MDKTRNKIFVGCLALLLVMVAGYALFSQNLNITGTAKAQGDFSLAITCQPGIPDNLKNIADFQIENGYYDDSCTVKGDVVTYSTKFKYPGAFRWFTLKVKNTGNMDAIYDDEMQTAKICFDSNENKTFEANECKTENLYYITQLAVEDKEGNIYLIGSDDAGLNNAYNSETGALKPGASLYFTMGSQVDKSLTAKKDFLYEMTLTHKMTFHQPTTK